MEMERRFLREETPAAAIGMAELMRETVRIGVVGMAPGAGSSFLGLSLAAALADLRKICSEESESPGAAKENGPAVWSRERSWSRHVDVGQRQRIRQRAERDTGAAVGFLELTPVLAGMPLLYDSLGMDKRFAGREFNDFYERVRSRRGLRGLYNLDEGINWALKTPQTAALLKEDKLTAVEKLRLLCGVSARTLVCDLGCGNEEGELEQLLAELDTILFVIDPLPSRLLCGEERLSMMKRLENRGAKVIWAVNKYSEGINRRALFGFLKIKKYVAVPLADPAEFYTAEYNCRLPLRSRIIAASMQKPLEEIIKLHRIHI